MAWELNYIEMIPFLLKSNINDVFEVWTPRPPPRILQDVELENMKRKIPRNGTILSENSNFSIFCSYENYKRNTLGFQLILQGVLKWIICKLQPNHFFFYQEMKIDESCAVWN